jgi:hypothetical protein
MHASRKRIEYRTIALNSSDDLSTGFGPRLSQDILENRHPGDLRRIRAVRRIVKQLGGVRNCGSLRDPVAFQQAVKFPAVDTEDSSSAGFVAVLLSKNSDDVCFFQIVKSW